MWEKTRQGSTASLPEREELRGSSYGRRVQNVALRKRFNASRRLPINVVDEKMGEHFGRAFERERRRIAPPSKSGE
jgi:hypothetical protein